MVSMCDSDVQVLLKMFIQILESDILNIVKNINCNIKCNAWLERDEM